MLPNINDITERRRAMGVSQKEHAQVIGIHPSALSRIESGRIDCRESTLRLLSEGLDIIENNALYSITGVILIDKTKFKGFLHDLMINELDSEEAQKITDLVIFRVCNHEL